METEETTETTEETMPDVEEAPEVESPDDDLTAPREQRYGWEETRTLQQDLTDERRDILSAELAKGYQQLEATKTEKSGVVSTYTAKIKSIEGECSKKAQALNDGFERMPVRCRWDLDYTNGVKNLVRLDTEETIETKVMTMQEKQLKLDEFNGAAVEVPEETEERTGPALLHCNVCGWDWDATDGNEIEPCPKCESTAVSYRAREEGEGMEGEDED